MNNDHTCRTCIDNDYGFCDKKGILVEDDDGCEKWEERWNQEMEGRKQRRDSEA